MKNKDARAASDDDARAIAEGLELHDLLLKEKDRLLCIHCKELLFPPPLHAKVALS